MNKRKIARIITTILLTIVIYFALVKSVETITKLKKVEIDVNGMEILSTRNVDEVYKSIENSYKKQNLVLTFGTKELNIGKVGNLITIDKEVLTNYINKNKLGDTNVIPNLIEVDKDKLKSLLESKRLETEFLNETIEPYINYIMDRFQIYYGENGSYVPINDSTLDCIVWNIKQGKFTIDLKICQKQLPMKTKMTELYQIINELNNILNTTIVYSLPNDAELVFDKKFWINFCQVEEKKSFMSSDAINSVIWALKISIPEGTEIDELAEIQRVSAILLESKQKSNNYDLTPYYK